MNKLIIKRDDFPPLNEKKSIEKQYNLIMNDKYEIRMSDNDTLIIKSIDNCIKWFNNNLFNNSQYNDFELKHFINTNLTHDVNTNNYLIENYIKWKEIINNKHNNYQIEILKKSTDSITNNNIVSMEYHDFLLEDIDFDNIYMCQIMPGIYDIFIQILHGDHYDYIPAVYIEKKFNIRIKLNGRYIINNS